MPRRRRPCFVPRPGRYHRPRLAGPPRKISRLISGRVGESLFAERRRAVTWRSLGVGLLGVVFICGLTPFNDYVARNTNLIGSFLPIGLLLFFLVLVLVVNAPLSRFLPRRALSTPELAVAMGMMLVSCTLPSAGLMRYLPGHLTAVWQDADDSPQSLELLKQLNLPDWLFPTMADKDPALRGSDPVVTELAGRGRDGRRQRRLFRAGQGRPVAGVASAGADLGTVLRLPLWHDHLPDGDLPPPVGQQRATAVSPGEHLPERDRGPAAGQRVQRPV